MVCMYVTQTKKREERERKELKGGDLGVFLLESISRKMTVGKRKERYLSLFNSQNHTNTHKAAKKTETLDSILSSSPGDDGL